MTLLTGSVENVREIIQSLQTIVERKGYKLVQCPCGKWFLPLNKQRKYCCHRHRWKFNKRERTRNGRPNPGAKGPYAPLDRRPPKR
jgi:hypothetical protein